MEDYRLVWFREKICAGFTDLKSLEVQSWFTAYNKRKNDIFKGLFNEECGFEILFIRESNEYIKFKKERIKQKEKQVQEFQNTNKGEEEEEEITRPGTIPLLTMDIDIIKESLHPHEIHILYFQRIKPGSIPKCRSSEHASLIMNEFLYVGQINKDPLILIKELIKEDVITDTSSFADRHIKKFANEIDKLIGDIPGEALIEIPYSVYALYKTPFLPEDSENDEETLAILSNTVWKWTEEIAKILEDINEKQKGNDSTGSDDSCLISDEIIEWDEKLTRLKSLVNQLSVPWIDKVISILIRGQIPQAEEFKRHCTQVHILLEEAEDNVKFLRTISQPTDILATSNDFTDMIGLLPTLMSSIRNIWVISKHYNTDKKICGLITKITNIIVSRVKEFIKFELLCEPERANHIAKNCKTLLSEWRRTYNKTREAIENSGREARWEFSVGSLFAPLEHCIFVCSDVIKVSNVLSQLSKCFSPALMSMTSKSEAMNRGNDKINSITESFKNLSFNVFEMKNEHHWRIHVAWFEREVRFLDAESARIAEETFDHLTSSGVSIKALEEMLGTNFRRAIGDRFMDKIDCIIKKFSKEIKCAEIDFDLAKDSPPIDKNFPPMSGAIYWAKDVGCNLEKSLNSLMRVDAVLSHSLWKKAKSIYDTFRAKLKDYETSRYNEWKSRVSDVLSENLTRTLLLADDPNDGFLSKRYRVNFTTDLSDTLAEVKHLDSLGFSVPEVAKNMSLQEERLIGVSDSLKNMLKRYHNSLDEIFPAEEELLFADIQETQVVLRPGHIRITWNSLGINEFILVGHQSISFVQTKINRIELIRKEIQSIADILSKTDLFSFECYSKVHFFSEFFLCISKNIKNRFEKLERLLLSLTPQFVKIEEILVQTRSRQAPRLKNYYAHWEMNIYEAIKELLLSNLDRYKEFIESRDPRFYIETILVDNNVSTDPSAPKVLDVMVGVIKEILEATKMFPRYYKGTWIPCKNISVDGEIKPLRSSMHDEIIRIPSIIDRVTHIQSLIVNILKESDNYLVSWKSYRTLWKFNKQQTCENFGRTIPTCVDFDEKLLFYYNLNRSIRNKEDHKDFKVMRLGLTKLKDGIQEHIIEWIQVLGKMLDSTATEKLKYLWDRVEYYRSQLKQVECTDEVEDTLKVISGIWSMSLEVEIGYLDIQERYRTLDMYGISGDKSMVVLAKNLTSKWEELYKMSKQVYFSIEKLKEKLSDIESSKILRFQSRLEELQGDFRQNGPSSKRTTLSNGLKALHKFKDLIGLFKEEAETLNGKQKVFKIPITHFPILRSLEKEMETIRDIYAIYEKLQDLFETLQDLPWGEYFTLAPGSQNYSKQKIFNIKREISFLEKSSTTHEGEGGLVVLGKLMDQLYSFEQYLNHLDCLQKGGLSQRHWKTLIEKTGLIFQEGDPQSYPDFKLKPFLNLPLNTLVEAISFVLETAENEDKIEKNYLKSLQIWKNKKFILESPRVRWQSFPMISNLSDLMTDLVEDDQNLDLMLSMKYAEPFKEKLEKHREILSKTGSVLKFIYETQNRCYSYAKVFISSEKQSYFENFGQIFKTYKGLMDELSRRVIVLDITLEDKTWKTYNEISRLLDSFSVQIHSFLDKKRQSFPRLYFLSNEELLILLGGCSPLALDQEKFVLKDDYMRVARKLFGFGVLSITLHKNHNHDYNPSALLLNNGDELKIHGRASNNANSSFSQTSSNYLNWFSMIVKEMKKSFASTIKKALNLMTSENIETFLSRSESLSLICYEVYWTETLENFMEKGFHGLLSLLNEDIEVILGMEMKDSSKRRDHDRKNNFLNLLLSKKLGLSILIENQIRSKEDFTYQADFLRSYWNKNLETLTLKQGLGALDFEYEFQVPKTHFLTESPQATYGIMMALGWQRRSFCISGYPGSGKTSIIESMASRLGRYCVKIDNMIGFKNMEYRILELLAQTCVADCWLVIENIENIPQDMLSKISNPLYQIEAAKELRLQQFNLTPSKEINLGPNASVFFTTRGSTNYNNSIPQSLRSRWRHISLIPPKDLSPWISWKLSVLGYSGIERLTKLIILSIDQITNLSDSLMNHIGPYKLINDIFGSIEMSEGSESGSVMSAILHVTEYYILEEFKPGVKEFLRTRFGNEEIPPRSSLRNLILEERINSIWDQEFEKVESLPGCTPSEKQKRSLVKAFQFLEDSTGVCVAFIGDTGTGKCLMARVLANLLDSELLFLSSSLYTAEELLNNNGIITSAIRNSNRKFTIILNPSMSNSIASVVANIIDKGIYINPSNYHSYKVETNSIKFVILLKPDEHLNSILIQRTRIIQLNERREVIVRMNLRLFFDSETSISDLYEKLSTIPITDPCLSFDSDQRLQQCVSLYKLFLLDFENSTQEESQLSVSSRLNTLVLSYIWSYGATLTDSNSVDDFEKRLRKIVKSYSDDIGLLQEESVFDQMYNGKEWARNENSLRRVVALLVHHGKGVFISGKLEADIWVDQFIKDMPEFHIVQIMLKRVAFTDRCLTQHLLSNMQIKGNRIYYPKSNRKLLYLVKGLSNEVDVDWMIDMSLHKSLHQYDQEREKITLRDVSILATLERGISGASSISKSNIFCPKYYKNQNPKSLDMTLLLPKNPDLSDNDKESINVVYKAYSSYNTNKGSLSSIKALGLTNMNIFSRLLKLDPQSWKKV
ncbi:dynein axonemal heavy chain 10 [Lepeophtheirus salmonis]|uniref:dynein axonemal heavy chain 10 n=1 Tax=Lepeophtheirus salmonis TaxID=72036 RepID=UPI003AF34AAC